MRNYSEKDISQLKNKTIKGSIKKTIIGVVIAVSIFKLGPNFEYQVALNSNRDYINTIMNDDIDRNEKIARIFKEAITKNKKIDEKYKEQIIDSFTNNVINRMSNFFTDETILNMYAVALTINVKESTSIDDSNLVGGNASYNAFSNTMEIRKSNDIILAHEMQHAVTKNGFYCSGVHNMIGKGVGINEGYTASLVRGDYSYSFEQKICDSLAIILGPNNFYKYYFNNDLDGLKNELKQYLTEEETNKIIDNLDYLVHSIRLASFVKKLGINFNEYDLANECRKKQNEIIDILKILYNNVYKIDYSSSNLGQMIFGNEIYSPELRGISTYLSVENEKEVLIEYANPGIMMRIELPISGNLSNEEKKQKLKDLGMKIGIEEITYTQTTFDPCINYIDVSSFAVTTLYENLDDFDYQAEFRNKLSELEDNGCRIVSFYGFENFCFSSEKIK